MSRLAVSVVVPTIGRMAMLEDCLRSILACDPQPDEIVVADQSSHGAAVEDLARTLSPLIRVVRQPGRGIARNVNLGLRGARTRSSA